MNTRCRPLLFACAAAAVLTLAACSKQKPAATAEKAPPPPPEPKSVVMTTGKIGLDDLPDISFESVEIIVLDKLTPELIMLLNQQHKCYTALIAPPPEPEPEQAAAPESEPASSDGLELLSDRDRERLNDMLTELKGELPARVTSGFTVNGTQRDFVSRESLYNRYAQPISTLTLENMVPVLQQMGQNMRADYDLLVKESESGSGDRALQAKADINWMAALSEYMPGYERLVRRYDSLRRRALLRDARSGGSSSSSASTGESAEQAFERFQLDNAMTLQVVCYKDALGTAFAQADGTFEVKGQGILLARIDDEHNRAVFFRDGMKAPTVVFSEVKTTEKTVQPE
ncbi:hypothetical protein H5P28_13590 [Ruficoccus amylovorans]|uniref:Uncharacterized protein n=1 Tax=Ruficoccus amylovorans TaxID=1804625 RepID=A0A842HI80_9BACT|nr:hypothetical protein [Ruficoccus amylovorans]MBC2595296.1 hypothetical protein [Ruficoccus amylovorans]